MTTTNRDGKRDHPMNGQHTPLCGSVRDVLPCILTEDHGGTYHEDANGYRWPTADAMRQAAELETLELGAADGRVSATCANSGHPTWLRAADDTRGCPWCRVAELEAARKALAARLRAGQRWERGRVPALVSEDYVAQSELRTMFGIPLAAPWDEAAEYRDAVRQELTGTPAEHRSVRAEQTEARITELERQLADAEAANTHMCTELDAVRRMLDPDDCALVDEMLATVSQWRTRAEQAEAVLEGVRALASRWAIFRAYGSAATELRAALDEQPTGEIATHRLALIRDATRLHRHSLISTYELYAVIEAPDEQQPTTAPPSGCPHCGAVAPHLPNRYIKNGVVGYCHGELTTEQAPPAAGHDKPTA